MLTQPLTFAYVTASSVLAAKKDDAAAGAAIPGPINLDLGWVRTFAVQIFGILMLLIAARMLMKSEKDKPSSHATTALNVGQAGLVGFGGVAVMLFGGKIAEALFQ